MRELSEKIYKKSAALSDVVVACKYLLKYSDVAKEHRDYIYNRISKHNIDKFNIGYFPDDDNLELLTKIVDEETLRNLRLIYTYHAHDRSHIITSTRGVLNHHNIIIPNKDEYGNIIALAGRTILSEEEQKSLQIPKYKNTFFDKSMHLFGLSQAKRAIYKKGSAVIVEGQIDCISCHSHGIYNAVALCGSNLSRWQLFLLLKMTDTIYLLLDNDSAGNNAEKRIMDRWSSRCNIIKLNLPDTFSDIDEYLRKSGTCSVFDLC